MPRRSAAALLAAGVLMGGLGAVHAANEASSFNAGVKGRDPSITVEDLVREGIVGDPRSMTWNDQRADIGNFAPDGRHVAVVLRRGDPVQGTNNASLLVYRTADLLNESTPRTLAEFSSSSNFQPISFLHWTADSKAIIFAATTADAASQIYRVNVDTGNAEQLTHEQSQLVWFTTAGGRIFSFVKRPKAPPEENEQCRKRGCLVTAPTLYAAQRGVPAGPTGNTAIVIHDVRTGARMTVASPDEVDDTIDYARDDLEGGLAPDGRFALLLANPKSIPTWWRDYTVDPDVHSFLVRGEERVAWRLLLVDLEHGKFRQVSDAPYFNRNANPIWIDGGRAVILFGLLESLTGLDDQKERDRRTSRLVVLSLDPVTLGTTRISALPPEATYVAGAHWHSETNTLRVQARGASGESLPTVALRRSGDHWKTLPAARVPAASPPQKVDLRIEQSINDPPMLVAIDRTTGAKGRVLDPNPWLASRIRARVEVVRWKSKSGIDGFGGLYYPVDYRPGTRYPLVLQTHGFNPKQFSLTGLARNFVAQPLAAHGIMVLQVGDTNTRPVVSTPAEWTTVQHDYEAAIDHLDGLGRINREQIGIVGWSRTGPESAYTITHSLYRFSAAAFLDSIDFGWWSYMVWGQSYVARTMEAAYGSTPFGAGLDTWRNMSPTFNFDRVQTPLLLWQSDSVVGQWDWYAGLRRLRKPVEYWYLPDGTHDLFKTGERLLTNHLLVDWFRFWLKGEEDENPEKLEQYVRWRGLRELQGDGARYSDRRHGVDLSGTAVPAARASTVN